MKMLPNAFRTLCFLGWIISSTIWLAPVQAAADEIKVLIPNWIAGSSRNALEDFLSTYSDKTGDQVKVITMEGMSFHPPAKVLEFVENERPDIMIGWSARSTTTTQLGRFDQVRPSWLKAEESFSQSGLAVSDFSNTELGKVVGLGAGFKLGAPDQEALVSIPGGLSAEMPVVVAIPLQGNKKSDESKKQIRQFFDILGNDSKGQDFLKALTLVPATSGDSKEANTKLLQRKDRDDDGCGCESSKNIAATCDPDGFTISSFSMSNIADGNFIPNTKNQIFDDDGCGCESRRMFKLEDYLKSSQFKKESTRMSGSSQFPAWKNHFDALSQAANSGKAVLVMTCDP